MTKMYIIYQPTLQCLVVTLFVLSPQISAFPRKFGNLSNLLMDFCRNSCKNGQCTTDGTSQYIVKCKCMEGFAGKYCDHSDCNPTCKHGSCVLEGTKPICKCEKGFSGEDCNKVNLNKILDARGRTNSSISLPPSLCALNFVCQNGGSCTRFQRGVRCQCVHPYIGTFCQDTCEKVCQNNGRCLLFDANPVCNCPWGYNGEFCEIKS